MWEIGVNQIIRSLAQKDIADDFASDQYRKEALYPLTADIRNHITSLSQQHHDYLSHPPHPLKRLLPYFIDHAAEHGRAIFLVTWSTHPLSASRFDHSESVWCFNVARHSNKTKINNFVCHQPIFGGGAIAIPPEADPAHRFTLWNAAWFWNGRFFVRSDFHLPLKQLQRGVSKCTNKS